MRTTINLADIDSFEPLPEGEYDVEIDKIELRSNKAGDGTYLNWELVVIDGEYENRRLWMVTSLKPNALFRLKQVLISLDLADDDDEEIELETDDDVKPSTQSGPRLLYPEAEGIEAIAVVKNEMYEGRERNRVNELYAGKARPKTKRSNSSTKGNGGGSTKRSSRDRGRRRVR